MRLIPVAMFLLSLALFPGGPGTLMAREGAEGLSHPSPEGLPRIVAILPFHNETEEQAISEQVRKVFYNHFSSKPYTDVELTLVDRKVVEIEKSTGKKVADIAPAEVCAALGCDGLVYGKVTSFRKVFAALYSQLNVGAEVRMVDTKTGKEIFRIADSVSYHGGSIPMSPLGALMSALSAAINLREIQQVRIVNELCHKLNEKIPSPEESEARVRPAIREVITNAAEGPFRQGKTISVGLEGDGGLVATFDIGNFRKGLPMNEVKPGLYTGRYLVLPGDTTSHMPITASLRKPGGLESQWIDPGGTVVIDTTPPPRVTGLKGRGAEDRVTLTWNGVKDTPDLKGYEVLRSEKPLTGFAVIGETEHTRYDDLTARPGVTYHYRVLAVDTAGNRSEPPDGVWGKRRSGEAEEVTGILREDVTLAGLYTLKGILRVPGGIALSMSAGTTVECGEGSSLVVEGSIRTLPGEGPVEFAAVKGASWKGIRVEKGEVHLRDLKVKGAEKALWFFEARGLLEGATLMENDTAFAIEGPSSLIVRDCHVASNKVAFHLRKTNATLTGNTVTRNGIGLSLDEFSGVARDNTIVDNEKNGVAATPARLDLNYFGSVAAGAMGLEGITVSRVYDGRPGQGKVVDVVPDPFASMAAEARKEAASRLLAEGQDYFTRRNYGRATVLLEESLRASPTPEVYYYLALSYQEMKEEARALQYLEQGVERFPRDTRLGRALAVAYYERGREEKARPLLENLLRMNPEDRQVRFLLERMAKP